MNVHTKEYLQDTVKFQHNGFKFTFDPNDNNIMLFDTTFGRKKAQAYGNKARWDFLQYIETQEQNYKHNDQIIVEKLEQAYPNFNKEWGLKETELFFEKNAEILHNLMNGIDKVYYSDTLTTLGIRDEIQIAFAAMDRGVAASTSIKGGHAVIKINLLQFISWDDNMRGTNKTKMGTENTTHIFESILKSLLHELVHAFIITCSPILKVNDTVLVHPRHLEYKEWNNKFSYNNHYTVGDINYSNTEYNADTGHGTMFMNILKSQFGQEFDYHDNYNVRQNNVYFTLKY
tara:strand:+ start:584 stop:1447 length:864 start_codon:yes stop_codon:yes gene_type:complete